MVASGTPSLLATSIELLVLGVWALFQIKYWLKSHRDRGWPTAEATIQKGELGRISMGGSGWIPANFLGYAYTVRQLRYGGYFVLMGNETLIDRFSDSLSGASISIRYDPSDLNISFLLNYNDPLFEGLTATQNPDKMRQAPAFDLQDAIRGGRSQEFLTSINSKIMRYLWVSGPDAWVM